MGEEVGGLSYSHLIAWEKNDFLEKKINNCINIKEILKSQRTNEFVFPQPHPKEDRTKQMKAFVSNLMSKKVFKRTVEKNDDHLRIGKKNVTPMKNRTPTFQ